MIAVYYCLLDLIIQSGIQPRIVGVAVGPEPGRHEAEVTGATD
jgi:hypothetical protein